MQKPTSAPDVPLRFVIVTLDHHIAPAVERARAELAAELPGLTLALHAATSFSDPAALEACQRDIREGDIVFVNMMFLEDQIRAVMPALEARRETCDAMICAMSAGEVVRQTKMAKLRMDGSAKGPLALLQRLRGSSKTSGGAGQMAMLRRLPKILSLIPGKAQELRAYFLTLSYWLSGSSENIANMVRLLVGRYADGPRRALRDRARAAPPREYPDVGVYHPRVGIAASASALPDLAGERRGTVGLVLMCSYVLAGDHAHYDAVIQALEARGLRVIPAFASGLDARPAIERFFLGARGEVLVDAVLSLTGFSLVGGPAFNDAKAAEEILARLDVPYVTAQPLEFQTLEQWERSTQGLTPIEATIMIAIPEIDGATAPAVFAGRSGEGRSSPMRAIPDRVERIAGRLERVIALRKTAPRDRKVAIVLYDFPPNGGAIGTAAHLSVFASLHATLRALARAGYAVEVPESAEALRAAIVEGNAARFGTTANVVARVPVDDHVRGEPHLAEIERAWGPAPGKHLTDGRALFVQGARFGNALVMVQPSFGYEGDPMRLLHARGFAPTHAFAAFYRYLERGFGADVVLHFGTHGALEFMPGKQVGLSRACWPDRLLGDLPHVYLYASNNPSEGTLAKRRSAATLVTYLTPPLARAGLYKELAALRGLLDRARSLPPGHAELARLAPAIEAQALALDLPARDLGELARRLFEIEQELVPRGLHVLGEPMSFEARVEYLAAIAEDAAKPPSPAWRTAVEAMARGAEPKRALASAKIPRTPEALALMSELARVCALLSRDHEMSALLHALGGGFVRPAPGGDLLRNPEVLPTGRNMHGFDPFGIPSAFAVADGARQAAALLAEHKTTARAVAIVLWGADNLKSGGAPIAQALALIGARPRTDAYGRLAGAALVPLAELGRPRIDVVSTLSGIFRDLLPMQTALLADAAFLAAAADEPLELNPIRRHALEIQRELGCDFETAALRVFSNAEGVYGANVNQLVESGAWEVEDELADAFAKRKCFAYGRRGEPVQRPDLLASLLRRVDFAFQNLESTELGVTTIDHYFDTLGGIGRAVQRARGEALPIYIGDQTRGDARVRTLSQQVALESRTRTLNPAWAEEMLAHGAEGVRQIEAHVTNTLGWSATTSQVEPWVYRELSRTYVLDPAMRERLARLNPKASLKLVQRLVEAHERSYWQPDERTLAALRGASDELEDRLEGIGNVA